MAPLSSGCCYLRFQNGKNNGMPGPRSLRPDWTIAANFRRFALVLKCIGNTALNYASSHSDRFSSGDDRWPFTRDEPSRPSAILRRHHYFPVHYPGLAHRGSQMDHSNDSIPISVWLKYRHSCVQPELKMNFLGNRPPPCRLIAMIEVWKGFGFRGRFFFCRIPGVARSISIMGG